MTHWLGLQEAWAISECTELQRSIVHIQSVALKERVTSFCVQRCRVLAFVKSTTPIPELIIDHVCQEVVRGNIGGLHIEHGKAGTVAEVSDKPRFTQTCLTGRTMRFTHDSSRGSS